MNILDCYLDHREDAGPLCRDRFTYIIFSAGVAVAGVDAVVLLKRNKNHHLNDR